jgi:putative acetyltransferase
MLVRRELPADVDRVHAVHRAAFETDLEARIAEALRSSDAWIGELSFVACVDGEVVGHVVCTRATVSGGPVLALGPIGVVPDRQQQGVGHALVHAVVGAADALGEPLIGLLGDPRFYSRFGFVLADTVGITPPLAEWLPHFQVRALTAYSPSLQGGFVYPAAFDLF